jgi:hypothetical protein
MPNIGVGPNSTLSATKSALVTSSGSPPESMELVRHVSAVGTGQVVS